MSATFEIGTQTHLFGVVHKRFVEMGAGGSSMFIWRMMSCFPVSFDWRQNSRQGVSYGYGSVVRTFFSSVPIRENAAIFERERRKSRMLRACILTGLFFMALPETLLGVLEPDCN